MSKTAKFNLWMLGVAVATMLVHYIIFWVAKYDEPFFFLVSLAALAALITSWIFARFERK